MNKYHYEYEVTNCSIGGFYGGISKVCKTYNEAKEMAMSHQFSPHSRIRKFRVYNQ